MKVTYGVKKVIQTVNSDLDIQVRDINKVQMLQLKEESFWKRLALQAVKLSNLLYNVCKCVICQAMN